MLVYGDQVEVADPSERLDRIGRHVARIAAMPAGIDRHARLVDALIEAGRLLQGVADDGFPGERPLGAFVHRLARCVLRSWDSGFAELGELPAVPRLEASGSVDLRLPEGFAFYAVYPEAYAVAARRLRLYGPPRVIGIRSIGTTLGAIVAAAVEAPPAITVRPFGEPFARQVQLPANLPEADAHYVIVDEGPGLSGSSFGAVADWLEDHGVPLERIAFLPSHAGVPGPHASEAHRRRWELAQRIPADFDGHLLELVRSWTAQQLGPNDRLNFAGFGAIGECKLDMARSLHAAGLTPDPIALVHGFLIERGCEAAKPLPPDEKPIPEMAQYIVARASLFPAHECSGANIEQLLEMGRRNISLALGKAGARPLESWNAGQLSSRVTRVRTDNRMDRTNWQRTPEGRLIKTDAVDHHQGHNLIGCQDPAWDVAGTVIEFGLDESETEALVHSVERGGQPIDRELLAFYRIAYAAFRLGEATLAGNGGATRYVRALRDLLHQHDCGGIRQESSVG